MKARRSARRRKARRNPEEWIEATGEGFRGPELWNIKASTQRDMRRLGMDHIEAEGNAFAAIGVDASGNRYTVPGETPDHYTMGVWRGGFEWRHVADDESVAPRPAGWIMTYKDEIIAHGTYDPRKQKITVSDTDMRKFGMRGYLLLIQMAERAHELGILP
jgi:hypothetical protein